MEKKITDYFTDREAPRIQERCLHLLKDVFTMTLYVCLTGDRVYRDMCKFTKERFHQLSKLLQSSNVAPSTETFERMFCRIEVSALPEILKTYWRDIFNTLLEKQMDWTGKKLRIASSVWATVVLL
jgi:hypothetical protein